MFGIRANKALFVYIALSFVLNEKGKTESASKFRCNLFEDKDYSLKTNTPRWSELSTPLDMQFTNADSFIDFRADINKAIVNVMTNHSLNDVDQFIRFIQAYKNQTGNKKNLKEFFNNYHVPFQPLEDPVSFLMSINHELRKLHPNAADRMYLVSAYVDPPENIFNNVLDSVNQFTLLDVKEKAAMTELTKYQFQRHVAGIINIKYFEQRGIIIVDPGYISGFEPLNPFSVVSLEKNNAAYHGVVVYPILNVTEITNRLKDPSNNLLLRNKFALASVTPSKPQHKVLYLRNKPFCSFMDSTTKGNLLAPYHRIMSFNQDGSRKGYLKFSVVPTPHYMKPIFWLGTFNRTTEGLESGSVNFYNFGSIKPGVISSNIKLKDEINKATKYLSLGPDYNLLGKLQTIQSEVFDDPDLVKDIYELNIKLSEKPKEPPMMSKVKNLFQASCFNKGCKDKENSEDSNHSN